MNITCQYCSGTCSVNDDELRSFNVDIEISCPHCKSEILLKRDETEKLIEEEYKQLPFGEELKQQILDSLDDLPPMPQVAVMARQIVNDPESNFMMTLVCADPFEDEASMLAGGVEEVSPSFLPPFLPPGTTQ